MKITNRTRIRVKSKICLAMGFAPWDRWSIIDKISKEYDFIYTSRRWNIYYFQPKDANNALLFALKYGEYIK